MSRCYEATVEVTGANPLQTEPIIAAIEEEWSPDPAYRVNRERTYIITTATGNLCRGESEQDAGERIARRIMQANLGPCHVSTRWTCLDDLPYELFDFDAQNYAEWFPVTPEDVEP